MFTFHYGADWIRLHLGKFFRERPNHVLRMCPKMRGNKKAASCEAAFLSNQNQFYEKPCSSLITGRVG